MGGAEGALGERAPIAFPQLLAVRSTLLYFGRRRSRSSLASAARRCSSSWRRASCRRSISGDRLECRASSWRVGSNLRSTGSQVPQEVCSDACRLRSRPVSNCPNAGQRATALYSDELTDVGSATSTLAGRTGGMSANMFKARTETMSVNASRHLFETSMTGYRHPAIAPG